MKTKTYTALFVVFVVVATFVSPAYSQTEASRAVDMMLVIDNSCSMFPREQILPGCQTFGSDPNFLRITGADLFLARLGFADVNEENYNLGVVGLGDNPKLLAPLQKLAEARDSIAQAIADPVPQSATQLIPALEMAYQELATSINQQPTNLKAVVFLTDGIPWPRENQTDADIERLIDSHPNIPLFVMLLQNGERDFEAYNLFWEQMQARKTNVYVYRIDESGQIEKTYNTIVAKIQNTIPADGRVVLPDQPYDFYVSEDVQRIILTIVHPIGSMESQIAIRDPDGNLVSPEEPGVNHFRGQENPVEVFSIFQPRLSDSLKNRTWTLTSNAEVDVFLDRQGAYRIRFLSPTVSSTDFSDSYLATGRYSPNKDFELSFNLLYSNGKVKLKPEIIRTRLILPDGSENILANVNSVNPDADGVYTVKFNPAVEYPAVQNQIGRFAVVLEVGSADETSFPPIPISIATLIIDVGPGPSLDMIEPMALTCQTDQLVPLTVKLADVDTAIPGSITVRVFNSDTEILLVPDATNAAKFSADITNLCQLVVEKSNCGQTNSTNFNIRLSSQLLNTSQQISSDQIIPVTIIGPECSPSPTPMPTPNCDGDSLLDAQDQCPCQNGLTQFQGCPPPTWFMVIVVILLIGLVTFVIWVIPGIRVLLSPPPQAFVMACVTGDRFSTPKSIYKIGMERRVSQVKIGSDPKKVEVVVKGLQPVEFVVVRSDNKIQVLSFDVKSNKMFLRLLVSDIPSTISTSANGVSLKFSLKKDNLEC